MATEFVGTYSVLFYFKQTTAYEMRISDWSSDVCSSDPTLAREIGNGAVRPVAIGHGTRGHFRMPAPQPAADIAALFDDAHAGHPSVSRATAACSFNAMALPVRQCRPGCLKAADAKL